jgi:hypothetical protein
MPDPREPPGAAPRARDWLDEGTGARGPRAYPFVYLDHGARSLVRSEHDDTQVVRWSLREIISRSVTQFANTLKSWKS